MRWAPGCEHRDVNDLDRTVVASDAAERDGQRRLGEHLDRVEQSSQQLATGVTVEDGSQMTFDDAATEYDLMSHQVHRLLLSAVDHVDTMRRFLLQAGGVPPFGFYPLIRAALEGALAIWIVDHGKRHRRILRSLQFAHHSREDVAPLNGVLGGKAVDLERTRARLEQLRDAAGVSSDADITSFPNISDVVLVARGVIAELGPRV
jgi:hypothetical protein